MMESTLEILSITTGPQEGELLRALGGAGNAAVHQAGPYEALEKLTGRSWQAVVLDLSLPDVQGLYRACRRLDGRARLLALCRPADEPQARALLAEGLDDYFVLPLYGTEAGRLRQAILGGSRAQPGPGSQGLSGQDFAALTAATTSPADLEQAVSKIIKSHLGIDVSWQNPPAQADVKVLLTCDGPKRRLLVCDKSAQTAGQGRLLEDIASCLGTLAQAVHRTSQLYKLAVTDHLTGAFNRRYFYQITEQILQRAREKSLRVTLLLYDIDDFKSYNDRYGHAAGDEILRETARLMKQIVRSHDIVARIGGDEFAVLFWDKVQPRSADSRQPDSAFLLANRFVKTLQTYEFPSLGPAAVGLLTISGGLANFPSDGETCRQLLRSADLAIKQVKQTGKKGIRLVGATS